MENMDVLVRGVVMQNHGLGLGSISFQGVEWAWAWAVVVATILLALVSVTRVSVVSVGWTWGSKPGQVRVRVQSFSSLSDGGIVTAGGMFSAEILNCSADSCSEDVSSSSDCASEAAEMVFIFEKKTASMVTLPKQQASSLRAVPEKIARTRCKSQDFRKKDAPLFASLVPTEGAFSRPRREGIEWDSSPASLYSCGVDSLLPVWAQSISKPLVCTAHPLPSSVVKNTSSCQWDPLLKLRIRDAVVSDGRKCFSVNEYKSPLAPVATKFSNIVTLKDGVVRVWDSDAKSLMKSVHLSKRYGEATAFDVNWEPKVVAMGRKGGMVSIANLETAAYEKSFQTQQRVVQAVQLDRGFLSKTLFTGGPAAGNPGCSVSLYDSRSSSSNLSVNLSSSRAIHAIRSNGQELYVRDGAASLAAHDVRMLGTPCVSRVPCDVKYESGPEDRWWDIDTTFEDEHKDVDDEFWDCQSTDETKTVGASYMSGFVKAMSRNFSAKSVSQ